MFLTVMPDLAASCSIVRSFSCCASAPSLFAVSGVATMCNLSLSGVPSFNVTSNDVGVCAVGGPGSKSTPGGEQMPAPATRTKTGLGRRMLGSLDLLAGPVGVDGYLEQIRPTWAI